MAHRSTTPIAVHPPDDRVELAVAWRAMVLVAALTFVAASLHATHARVEPTLLPYQVALLSLPVDEQRTTRSAQEGLLELLRMRSDTGAWPTVEQLVSDGIPPFAHDPLSSSTWQWTRTVQGGTCSYLGVPAGVGRALLVSLVEPAPGAPIDPRTPVDDEHRRLRDGTLVHTTLWWSDKARLPAAIVAPAAQGFVQVRTLTTSTSTGVTP